MGANSLLVYGRDTKFKVYFNNAPWPVVVKTWRVQEQAVEAADGVNGEQRDRLQKITNFYKCTFDCYDDGSTDTLENLIANQQNEDAQQPDLSLSGGLIFTYRGNAGRRKAFVLKSCSLGPLDMNSGGRTTALNHALSFRAQYFDPVPAVP
jgi:hypothetical protein